MSRVTSIKQHSSLSQIQGSLSGMLHQLSKIKLEGLMAEERQLMITLYIDLEKGRDSIKDLLAANPRQSDKLAS